MNSDFKPAKLYKYVLPDRIDILVNQMIRFTPPTELNDPFDMTPIFDDIFPNEYLHQEIIPSISIENEIDKAVENAWNNLDKLQKRAVTKAQLKLMLLSELPKPQQMLDGLAAAVIEGQKKGAKNLSENFQQTVSKVIGILCLSENATSPLMWAHYASNYQGFIIEFNPNSSFFQTNLHPERDSMSGNDVLLAPNYDDPDDYNELEAIRKVIYPEHLKHHDTFLSMSINDLFYTKPNEWAYEREWRMIKWLKQTDKTITTPVGEIHLFKLPETAIKSVIFGPKAHPELIDNLKNILSEDRYSHVKCNTISLSRREQSIEVVPMT